MKLTKLLIFGILIPIVYFLYSLSPWSNELFVEKNGDYFYLFWSGIIFMHWLSFFLLTRFLKSETLTLKDLGYKLTKKGTIFLVTSFFTLAFLIFGYVEIALNYVEIDHQKLVNLSNFIPKTAGQRLFFILGVFSAGFCEEMIYRGYLINGYSKLGLNKWLAIVPAGISFVAIHGIVGYYQFWNYFIFALITGILFVWSKRLLPVIILHLVYNLLAMMAVLQAVVGA